MSGNMSISVKLSPLNFLWFLSPEESLCHREKLFWIIVHFGLMFCFCLSDFVVVNLFMLWAVIPLLTNYEHIHISCAVCVCVCVCVYEQDAGYEGVMRMPKILLEASPLPLWWLYCMFQAVRTWLVVSGVLHSGGGRISCGGVVELVFCCSGVLVEDFHLLFHLLWPRSDCLFDIVI